MCIIPAVLGLTVCGFGNIRYASKSGRDSSEYDINEYGVRPVGITPDELARRYAHLSNMSSIDIARLRAEESRLGFWVITSNPHQLA